MPHAIAVAKAFGANLTVLHALEPPHEGPEPLLTDPLDWEMQRAEALVHLEAVRSDHAADNVCVRSEILEGRPAEEIRNWADSNGVDLTVLGSHGASGVTEWSLASTARKLIEGISGSVLLVPAGSDRSAVERDVTYRRILVLLDGSLRAESVLPIASGVARAHGSELLLLHIVPTFDPPCPAELDDEEHDLDQRLVARNARAAEVYLHDIARRLAKEGTDVRTAVALGGDVRTDVVHRIARGEVDLLILSGHGHGGRAELAFGSVATFLLEHSTEPLLVVREPTAPRPQAPAEHRSRQGLRLPQPAGP